MRRRSGSPFRLAGLLLLSLCDRGSASSLTDYLLTASQTLPEDADELSSHGLYALLGVNRTAEADDVSRAFDASVSALERALRHDRARWFDKSPFAPAISTLFAALDGNGDGALSATEANEVLRDLHADVDAASVAEISAFRRRVADRRPWWAKEAPEPDAGGFASAPHVLAALTFASLLRARRTLSVPDLRAAYDAAERGRVLKLADALLKASPSLFRLRALPSLSAVVAACAAGYVVVLCAWLLVWAVAAASDELLYRAAAAAGDGGRAAPSAPRAFAGRVRARAARVLGRWRPRPLRWRRRVGWDGVVLLALFSPKLFRGAVLLATSVVAIGAWTIALNIRACAGAAVCAAAVATYARRRPLAAALASPRNVAAAACRAALGAGRAAGRLALRAARAVAGALACIVLAVCYTYAARVVEHHGGALLATAAAVVVFVAPARRLVVDALVTRAGPLARALAESGLCAAPEVRVSIDLALERLGELPVVDFVSAERLTDAELVGRLEDAGFCRESPEPPSRAELVRAYDDAAFGMCAVCLSNFADGDRIKRLEFCAHCFHVECLEQWVSTCNQSSRPLTCPYCASHIGREAGGGETAAAPPPRPPAHPHPLVGVFL